MQQCRCLEELHRCRRADDGLVVRPTAGAITPVEEGGPEPLATLEKGANCRHKGGEVVADLGEDPGLAGDLGVDSNLHACAQVVGVQGVRHRASGC
jgi:hypothetical protein